MQAIETYILSPTNHSGTRVKAVTAAGSSKVFAYDHGIDHKDNHIKAAKALMEELEWGNYDLATGSTRKGYCHVLIPA